MHHALLPLEGINLTHTAVCVFCNVSRSGNAAVPLQGASILPPSNYYNNELKEDK